MSSRRTIVMAALLVAGVALTLSFTGLKELQPDSYRLLYAGRWIAQHGLPVSDPFTVASGQRAFADQQWLAELTSFEVWRIGGYAALTLLMAAMFAGAYALLAVVLRRLGASVPMVVAAAVLAIFGSLSLIFVRAQLFALPLFVGVLWCCLEASNRRRARGPALGALALLVLWANVHGSVLIGAGLVCVCFGFKAVRERSPGHGLVAALAALTPLATPYGLHLLAYYHAMIGNNAVALADIEWDPPAFPALSFFQFALPVALAVGSAVAALARRRAPHPLLIAAVALSGAAAATAMRNNVWLAISAAALIAQTSPAWLPSAPPRRGFIRVIGLAGVVLIALGAVRLTARGTAGYEAHAPLKAIAATASYALRHPCARVLGDTRSASALLWLEPSVAGRVGFDGELEAYSQPALTSWVRFQSATGRNWLAAAGGYQLLIGSTGDQPGLVRALTALPGAPVLARDHAGVAVLQRGGQCAV